MSDRKRESEKKYILFFPVLGCFCLFSIPYLHWKDGIILGLLALGTLFILKKKITNFLSLRLLTGITLFYFSLRLPTKNLFWEFEQSMMTFADYGHTLIGVAGIIYLVNLLREVHKQRVTSLHTVDMALLIGFTLFLIYGATTLVLGKLLSLSVYLNHRLFSYFSTAVILFLLTLRLEKIKSTARKTVLFSLLGVIVAAIASQIFLAARITKLSREAANQMLANQFQSSLVTCTRIYELNRELQWTPFTVSALNNLGILAFRQQNYDDAKEYFRQVVRIRDSDPVALFGLGSALSQSGKEKQAYPYFRQFIKLDFSLSKLEKTFHPAPETFKLLGLIFKEHGKFPKAMELFYRTKRAGLISGEIEYHLGTIYFALKNPERAKFQFQKAADLGFQSPDLYYKLALIAQKRKKWHNVLKYGRDALHVSPTYIDAYSIMEEAQLKINNPDKLAIIRKRKAALIPELKLENLRTKDVILLGYTIPKRTYRQGDEISVIFFSRIARQLEKKYEPIYLILGKPPLVYSRTEFNLLDQLKQESRPYFEGDIVISKCSLDGRTLLPGLSGFSYYLPGNINLDQNQQAKTILEVDSSKYLSLSTLTITPHLYRRISFKPHQLRHIFDEQLDVRYLKTYFYLANRYGLDIPLLFPSRSFSTSSIIIVSALTFAGELEHGHKLAQLVMHDINNKEWIWTIRAGVDSSEWAWDCPGMRIAHRRAKIATSWTVYTQGREFEAHKYYSVFTFPKPIVLKKLRMQYLSSKGCIEVCDLIIQGHSNRKNE
ncbi:tetratricopeptide repeat protein [candidate division CSSED10-310 bacterium]|uniref:Tetratricopeptide repeat protein n=1 Tax=candidate division CSSED10-310 bacterium TaxID=2855610 RepID=A0ABV6YU29_UNCC1